MQFRPKKNNTIGPKTVSKKTGKETIGKLPMLNIRQEHGDILIQHGAKIQKLYEVGWRLFTELF